MSKRPTDHLQPSGKRRPGEQLTKDSAGDSDEEGPAIDPGTWGKADAATLARRKVVRARRVGPGAEAPAAAEPAASEQAASGNPFAGVSLAAAAPPPAAANPFAGISLLASQPATAATAAAPAAEKTDAAGSKDTVDRPAESAAAKPTASQPKAAEEPAAADAFKDQTAAIKPADTAARPAEMQSNAVLAASEKAAGEVVAALHTAAAAATADAADKATTAAAPTADTSLFGGSVGGFGGFGGFGAAATGGEGGFGTGGAFGTGGGFGGFAAAAKDGAAGGSLFGSYTAPKPGSFGTVPAFGAARQSKDGEDEAAPGAGDGEGEGNEVFGGDNVQPVVQLSEVPKQTGEEDEETVYTVDGSLFEFAEGKQWRERGKGELRLNVDKTTQQARMVMRQRGSQKLLLNARLYPKMATSTMVGGKGVTFAAANAAVAAGTGEGIASQEGTEKSSKQEEGVTHAEAGSSGGAAHIMRTYALKVKNAEKIDEFIAAVDQHKAGPSGASIAAAEDAV